MTQRLETEAALLFGAREKGKLDICRVHGAGPLRWLQDLPLLPREALSHLFMENRSKTSDTEEPEPSNQHHEA